VTAPVWLDVETTLLLHAESIRRSGGADGVRDQGLLESALSRPLNQAAYGEPKIFELAAAYGFGIARNHPFIDGNKRTAFAVAGVFLALNGWRLVAPPADATATFLALAAGTLSEAGLAAWLERGCKRLA